MLPAVILTNTFSPFACMFVAQSLYLRLLAFAMVLLSTLILRIYYFCGLSKFLGCLSTSWAFGAWDGRKANLPTLAEGVGYPCI